MSLPEKLECLLSRMRLHAYGSDVDDLRVELERMQAVIDAAELYREAVEAHRQIDGFDMARGAAEWSRLHDLSADRRRRVRELFAALAALEEPSNFLAFSRKVGPVPTSMMASATMKRPRSKRGRKR